MLSPLCNVKITTCMFSPPLASKFTYHLLDLPFPEIKQAILHFELINLPLYHHLSHPLKPLTYSLLCLLPHSYGCNRREGKGRSAKKAVTRESFDYNKSLVKEKKAKPFLPTKVSDREGTKLWHWSNHVLGFGVIGFFKVFGILVTSVILSISKELESFLTPKSHLTDSCHWKSVLAFTLLSSKPTSIEDFVINDTVFGIPKVRKNWIPPRTGL